MDQMGERPVMWVVAGMSKEYLFFTAVSSPHAHGWHDINVPLQLRTRPLWWVANSSFYVPYRPSITWYIRTLTLGAVLVSRKVGRSFVSQTTKVISVNKPPSMVYTTWRQPGGINSPIKPSVSTIMGFFIFMSIISTILGRSSTSIVLQLGSDHPE
jgi:hypothetical protein